MPSLREPQRRALDAILADQDHGAPTVYCWQEGGGRAGGEQREKQLWPMGAQGKAGYLKQAWPRPTPSSDPPEQRQEWAQCALTLFAQAREGNPRAGDAAEGQLHTRAGDALPCWWQ